MNTILFIRIVLIIAWIISCYGYIIGMKRKNNAQTFDEKIIAEIQTESNLILMWITILGELIIKIIIE